MAHRARTKLAGDGAGAVDVVGEHRRVEPIDGVVRDLDGVLLVGRRNHAEHRPEDLFTGNGRRVVDVAEDGRFDVVAALELLGTPSTGGERRAFVDTLGDVALDAITLAFGDERAHLRLLLERVADSHL